MPQTLTSVSVGTSVTQVVPPSVPHTSGSPGSVAGLFRPILLENKTAFPSEYPPDAALEIRVVPEGGTTVFNITDFDSGVKVNGAARLLDDGSLAAFFRLHVIHIQIGRADLDVEPTGTVDFTLTALWSDVVQTAHGEGDYIVTDALGRAVTTSAVSIDFGTSTGYVARLVIVGRKSNDPEAGS